MLVKHAETAQSMGIPPENMLIIQNGDVVEVSESGIRVAGKVQTGVELVDTSSSGMVSGKVLKERQRLAEEHHYSGGCGGWNGKLMMKPEIHLRGVVTSLDRSLQSGCKIRLNKSSDRWSDFTQSLLGTVEVGWAGLQVQLERNTTINTS